MSFDSVLRALGAKARETACGSRGWVRSSSGPTGDGKISASSGSRTNEKSTAAPSGTPAMKRRYLSRSPHSSAVTLYLSWTSSLIRGQSRALSLRKPALPAAEELLLTWGVGRLGVEACVEPTRARLCVAAMLAGNTRLARSTRSQNIIVTCRRSPVASGVEAAPTGKPSVGWGCPRYS